MDNHPIFGQIAETGPKVVQTFVFFHKKRAATNLTTLPNGDTPFPLLHVEVIMDFLPLQSEHGEVVALLSVACEVGHSLRHPTDERAGL